MKKRHRGAKKEEKRHLAERKAKKKIDERIESGEIIEQKCWSMIKELNSYSQDRLNATAIVEGTRKYSYREMFSMWKRYAAVFSALGITGKAGSRVAMTGASSAEVISAFYGLNMTGASASIVLSMDFADPQKWENLVRQEHITDLVLDDCKITPELLKRLLNEKYRLGLGNIIVLHVNVGEGFFSKEERNRRTKQLMETRYRETLHIDEKEILLTRRDSKGFEEYAIDAQAHEWSKKVMQIVKGLEQNGEK